LKTLDENKYKKYSKSKNPFKANWDGIPATVRQTLFEKSLAESVFASIFGHVFGILFIWLLSFAIVFFGIAPKLFPTPEPKIKDIEFNLNTPTSHRHHYKKIKAVQSTKDADAASASAQLQDIPAASPKPQSKTTQPKSDTINKREVAPKVTSHSLFGSHQKTNASSKSGAHSKSSASDSSSSSSLPMSGLNSMSSGLSGSGRHSHHAAGFDASKASGFGNSASSGSGTSGHSGFDKNTTRKMISTYDISPYVSELKRNIRWNWKPAKSGASKRVDLFLRIAKDGRVVILNVKRTSEVGEVDNAALNAVRKSQPLNPLPSKYAKNYLDVVFTFDGNSLGSRY